MGNYVFEIISALLAIVTVILGIVLVLQRIKYIKLKIKVASLQEKNTSIGLEQFEGLIERLDTKVSAFGNYLLSRSRGAKDNYIDVIEDAFFYKEVPSVYSSKSSTVSLFNYRAGHYAAEKVLICKQTLDVIMRDKTLWDHTKVILLLDSGSTVFPMFRLLCEYYWNKQYKNYLEKIIIFTNNIPGLSALIKYGRLGSDVNAEMIYECNVIPGIAEGKYSAILGSDGASHLKYRLDEIKDKNKSVCVVALITGNYISIKDGILWRGKYHGQVKNALIANADYICILSPLGKIFPYTANDLNKCIAGSRYPLPPYKDYKDLRDNDALPYGLDIKDLEPTSINKLLPYVIACNKPTHLITTKRPSSSIYPTELAVYFEGNLREIENQFKDNLHKTLFAPQIESEQVINELQIYKDSREAFLNYEFPHPEIRTYMRDYFKREESSPN